MADYRAPSGQVYRVAGEVPSRREAAWIEKNEASKAKPMNGSDTGAAFETPTGQEPGAQFMANSGGAEGFTALRVGLMDDPKSKVKFLAAKMFPNEPVESAMNRFAETPKGELIFQDNSGTWRPAVSGGKMEMAGQMGPAVVGALVTGPAAVLGAMGGAGWRKVAGNLSGEDQSISGNLANIGMEGIAGKIGDVAGQLVVGGLNRKALPGITREGIDKAEAAARAARERTGVDLDVAQASGDETLLALRSQVRAIPGKPSETLAASEASQEGAIKQKLKEMMDLVGTSTSRTEGGVKAWDAARKAMKRATDERTAATNPLFEEAYASAAPVNVTGPMTTLYQSIRGMAGSEKLPGRATKLKEFLDKITPEQGGSLPLTTVAAIKDDIDTFLAQEMKGAKGTKLYRDLTELKAELVKQARVASPKYGEALDLYSKISKNSVEPLQNSMVGTVAGLKRKGLADVALKVFGRKVPDVGEVVKLRAEFERVGEGDAFKALARNWLDDAVTGATEGGGKPSYLSVVRVLNGNPKKREMMMALMGPQNAGAFVNAMDALEYLTRANRVTARLQDTALERAGEGVGQMAKRVALSPFQTLRDRVAERTVRENAELIATALTDPKKAADLKKFAAIKDKTERAIRVAGTILAGLDEKTTVTAGWIAGEKIKETVGGAHDALTNRPGSAPPGEK